jgi:thiol-disulfide isomerase/thioredoxin
VRKVIAAMAAIRIKNLSSGDIMRLDSMTWRGFELNNAALYQRSPKYRELIDAYLVRVVFYKPKYLPKMMAVAKQQASEYESKIDIVRGEITDPYIREALLYRFTRLLLETKGKDTSQYYTDYLRDAIDPVNAASIRGIHEKLEKYKPGSPAPEFVYPDVQGEPVALSGMKGHYVYIDVWATWCGPCKAELPFLKEVETKYEGQNIRFIGVSVDAAKDADKWKKFVADNKLPGLQLMADHDFTSDFIDALSITSIPRFILIDPGGKIVSENASRPSNPELVVQLNKLLGRPL